MEPISPFPAQTPAPADASAKQSKPMWIIAAVVVIAVAALAWYFSVSRAPALPAGEDAATKALETQGASDEIEAIDADLETTDLEGLDQELQDIEAELVQ